MSGGAALPPELPGAIRTPHKTRWFTPVVAGVRTLIREAILGQSDAPGDGPSVPVASPLVERRMVRTEPFPQAARG